MMMMRSLAPRSALRAPRSSLVALGAFSLATLTSGCPDIDSDPGERPPYTEAREACAERDPLRKAYFGDLHVHTAFSFDAWTYDVRTTPSDAYRFARGEAIYLPPLDANGKGTTEVRLDRPLDFAAVTDHAEYLGETSLCSTPGSPAYDTSTCVAYRPPASSFLGFNVGAEPPARADFCQDTTLCTDAAAPVWQTIQEAAEQAYDRTADCQFTTFVGYEYSLSPLGTNLHRNVLFRNEKVIRAPITTYEADRPHKLWEMLAVQCLYTETGCDVLAIPHNSNLSNGRMFEVEYPGAKEPEAQRGAAALRARMEPLIEIYQHKGDSECTPGLGTFPGEPDELCSLEKQQSQPLKDCGVDGTGWGGISGLGCTSWRDYVRGALESGMMEQERIGENPYKLGFIGSTDTHNGTPGRTEESTYEGHLGLADQSAEAALSGSALAGTPLLANPGGLAGVWAEENSRDALFDALRRRETFATTGTRIVARMFAGWEYPADLCDRADLVSEGYRLGVPMGGDLAGPVSDGAPTIVVSALRDPGTEARPGTPLQRAQVVKLWLDDAGEPHEAVFDVAGDPDNGATVDTATCETKGQGFDALCAVWTDPDFDPGRPAVYYARIVENPTCRWSTHLCNRLTPEKRAALNCDALGVPDTVQERAWTSPVWYTP
ncbi:MAG: DUF3604 domain-containing protein [Polyangiaceae bacterium]